jgi:hypothetical protein
MGMNTQPLTESHLLRSVDRILDIKPGSYLYTIYIVVGQTARVSSYTSKKQVFQILCGLMNALENDLQEEQLNIGFQLEIEKLLF